MKVRSLAAEVTLVRLHGTLRAEHMRALGGLRIGQEVKTTASWPHCAVDLTCGEIVMTVIVFKVMQGW